MDCVKRKLEGKGGDLFIAVAEAGAFGSSEGSLSLQVLLSFASRTVSPGAADHSLTLTEPHVQRRGLDVRCCLLVLGVKILI